MQTGNSFLDLNAQGLKKLKKRPPEPEQLFTDAQLSLFCHLAAKGQLIVNQRSQTGKNIFSLSAILELGHDPVQVRTGILLFMFPGNLDQGIVMLSTGKPGQQIPTRNSKDSLRCRAVKKTAGKGTITVNGTGPARFIIEAAGPGTRLSPYFEKFRIHLAGPVGHGLIGQFSLADGDKVADGKAARPDEVQIPAMQRGAALQAAGTASVTGCLAAVTVWMHKIIRK
jgi:hypothetical protein